MSKMENLAFGNVLKKYPQAKRGGFNDGLRDLLLWFSDGKEYFFEEPINFYVPTRVCDFWWIDEGEFIGDRIIHWGEIENHNPLTFEKMDALQSWLVSLDAIADFTIWFHVFNRYGINECLLKTSSCNEMVKFIYGNSLFEQPKKGLIYDQATIHHRPPGGGMATPTGGRASRRSQGWREYPGVNGAV